LQSNIGEKFDLSDILNGQYAASGKPAVLSASFRRNYTQDMEEAQRKLSREAVEEFRAIYFEEFGETLTNDEVREIALRLLRLFGILLQPIPGGASKKCGEPR
jgi:hypothetical protein